MFRPEPSCEFCAFQNMQSQDRRCANNAVELFQLQSERRRRRGASQVIKYFTPLYGA